MLTKTLILVPTRFEAYHLFGQEVAACLRWNRTIDIEFGGCQFLIAKCGFSLMAGIHGYPLIANAQKRIDRVVLVGIGGAFQKEIELGSVVVGDRTRCVDVGIPSKLDEWTVIFKDAEFISDLPEEENPEQESDDEMASDEYPLLELPQFANERKGLILSVATCSKSPETAADRLNRFPDAVIEEMESYSIAVACRKLHLPLAVIRGVSNYVGERDKSKWRVKESLASVKECLLRAVSDSTDSEI